MPLQTQPVTFAEACSFVKNLHRHHRPPVGSVFSIGVNDGEKLVGVIMAGRPVSRMLDTGTTIEVSRCCTDGTRNACSLLYGAAWRAAKSLGWSKMITYTLPEEGGSSLRASGAKCVGEKGGGAWVYSGESRKNDHPLGVKWRWEWYGEKKKRFRLNNVTKKEFTLFDCEILT